MMKRKIVGSSRKVGNRLRKASSRFSNATGVRKRFKLCFERLESRQLLAAWSTVGEASVFGYEVSLGQRGRSEDGMQPEAVHAATLKLPEASQYRIGFQYQLASWDSYNSASLGENKGYWDAFSFSVTDIPYPALTRRDPLSFPGRGFTWGGSTFADSNLATTAGTVYQTFIGHDDEPSYLNIALDTSALPQADDTYPSWGRVVVHANDVAIDELRMAESEELGVEVEYTIFGANVPDDTKLEFFWASGPSESAIIGSSPVATQVLSELSPLVGGRHVGTVAIPNLSTPPLGASHLLVRSREFTNEMITTNNVATLDIFGTYPLKLQPVDGEFEYNESAKRFEASGTILIGLTPKAGESFQGILKLEGDAWYNRQSISLSGKFYSNLGPVLPTLFDGTVTIKNGSAKSLTLTDNTADENQFSFAGLSVTFDSIALRSDGLGLQGSVSLPSDLGGVKLSVNGNHWLLFTDRGTEVTGGRIEFPDASIKLENVLELEATGLAVEYTGSSATEPAILKLQGEVTIPAVFGFKGDFSEENYIQVSEGEVELVGKISVENVVFVPKLWELNEAFIAIDTTKAELVGGGSLRIPAGVDIEARMGFVGGELDQVMLGVSDLELPLGTTGAFLRSVHGSLDNLTGNEPPSFTGTVGITYGPEISVPAPQWLGGPYSGTLLRSELQATINRHSLTGMGSFDLISPNPNIGLVEGAATSTVNWTEKYLTASGRLAILNGLVNYNASFRGDSSLAIDLMGGAEVRLPDVPFTPFLNGQLLGSGQVHVRYRDNGSGSDDFVKFWGTADLPLHGFRTIGIKLDFNGNTQIIGDFDQLSPQFAPFGEGEGDGTIAQFFVDSGTEELLLHLEWEKASVVADYVLTAPDGTSWNSAQIANALDLSEVSFLASNTTRAIAVRTPQSGLWRLSVSNMSELGAIQADAFRDAVNQLPEFEFVSATSDADSHMFTYTLSDPDSYATAKFFVTLDSSFDGGILVGEGGQFNTTMAWDSADSAAGQYWLYAVVEDGDSVSQKVTWPSPLTVANSAPYFTSVGAWDVENELLLNPGEHLQTFFAANDIDSDPVRFALQSEPDFVSLSERGVLTATAPRQNLSSQRIELNVEVSDQRAPALISDRSLFLVLAGSNEIVGTLEQGQSMTWYRDVRTKQDLRLTPLRQISPGFRWEVRDASSSLLFSGPASHEVTVPIHSTGTLQIKLVADGVASETETPFHFSLSEAIALNQAAAARFDYIDQAHEFQVNAVAGERLLVELFNGVDANRVGFVIEAPDGRFYRLGKQNGAENRLSVFDVTLSGTHRIYLTAHSLASSSSLNFQFAIRSIDESSSIVIGQPANISVPSNGSRLITFEAVSGQIVRLKATSDFTGLTGTIFDSDRQRLSDAVDHFLVNDPRVFLFAKTGIHYLIVESNSAESQTLDFVIEEVKPELLQWQFGQRIVDSNNDLPSEIVISLKAGEIVFIDAHCESWQEPFCGPTILSNGQMLMSRADYGIIAPSDATYRLVAMKPHDFTIHKLDASRQLQPGVLSEFSLTSSELDLPYWINVAPGQQLSWTSQKGTPDGIGVSYFHPSGHQNLAFEKSETILREGPLLISLRDVQADATQEPRVHLLSFMLTDPVATELNFDTKYTETLSAEQPISFLLVAKAGEQLYYNSLDNASNASMTIFGPNGKLFESLANSNVGLIEVPFNGQYKIQFDTPYETDSVSFQINRLANSAEIGYEQIVEGQLIGGLESKWWTFPGFEGQKVALLADGQLDNLAEVQLYTPSGQFLLTGPLSMGLFATLPEDGTYTMALIGSGDTTSDFGFKWKQIHTSWQNPVQPLDVNGDGKVLPIDALIVINHLNRNGTGTLDEPNEGSLPPPFLDVLGTGRVLPINALAIINYLNRTNKPGSLGEGEGGWLLTPTGFADEPEESNPSQEVGPFHFTGPDMPVLGLQNAEFVRLVLNSASKDSRDDHISRMLQVRESSATNRRARVPSQDSRSHSITSSVQSYRDESWAVGVDCVFAFVDDALKD